MGDAIMAALLALAGVVAESGISAVEAPDTAGFWSADCEGALVRRQAPTLVWTNLNSEVRKA